MRTTRWRLGVGAAVAVLLASCGGSPQPEILPATRQPADYHPADTNQDGTVALAEAVAYATAFRKRQSWPVGPSPVSLSYAVNACTIFKRGGRYHADAAAPVPFVSTVRGITVSPSPVALAAGAEQAFGARVEGGMTGAVTWSVQESGGGTITTAGVYTAPATAGTYHVVATSQADPTKSATATVTVEVSRTGTLTVTITPQAAIDAGARWLLDGSAAEHASGESVEVAAGDHNITFTAVSGYYSPAQRTLAVSAAGSATTTGTYRVSGVGQIEIN